MPDVSKKKHRPNLNLQEFINELIERVQQTVPHSSDYSIVEKLDDHEIILQEAHSALNLVAAEKKVASSGVEWFLDNYFIIKESIELVQDDLPPDYYNKLPALEDDQSIPRIYLIASEIVEFFQVDLVQSNINAFLTALQEQVTLKMSEIWALPLMLRLILITILRESIAELFEESENISLPIEKTTGRLGDADPDEMVARSIRSLQLLSRVDWKEFFEKQALVEEVLRTDPADIYSAMDFDTRDRYRKKIESLAEKVALSEIQVAEKAISLCSDEQKKTARRAHVGYYLIGDGLDALKEKIQYQWTFSDRFQQFVFNHAAGLYLSGILALTALVVIGLMAVARSFQLAIWQQWLVGILALVPASSVGVNLMNSLLTWVLTPNVLPKMDYSDGVPGAYRTMVVIPALFSSKEEVEYLVHQLELHYLANRDKNIGFALLSDFADAPEREMPEDSEILEHAKEKLISLNKQYDQNGRRPFFLFHRPREWNPAEGVWMGWERKRGKLTQFNQLLLENDPSPFSIRIGDSEFLQSVRFVITVDSDTIIPRKAAMQLIATLAHPLNRAEFSEGSNRVKRGYTILQPRTEVKPTSVTKTVFTRVFAGDIGIDLYTRAVSNVYQDFFGEGSYVGKGIYDVAAFERSLRNKVPENALLSHDLFEGLQGRAGLVSDIVFFEEYPPDYANHVERLHRWVRGDWQLLPWVLPRVPMESKGSKSNPFSAIDLWKIIDNLRRSLLAPSELLLLLSGWIFIQDNLWLWTALVLLISAFPLFKDLVVSFSSRVLLGNQQNFMNRISTVFLRWLFWLIFLPYRSLIMLDAIVTTFVRLFISHQRLLQWQTAAHTVRIFGKERKITVIWSRMLGAPILSGLFGLLISLLNPSAIWTALPFLLTWLISPQIAYWISQEKKQDQKKPLSESEIQSLRHVARRTWLYFERFIGPDDHWLPPDHFQEHPKGMVAHRTSPTNIGLMLLSTTSAYDLGYIGVLDYIFRMNYTFNTLDDLEKYRGHLLNWYDTRNKKTLSPRYVSTVDSGNYAASLYGLKQSLLSLPGDPICPEILYQGLFDSLGVFCELLDAVENKDLFEVINPLYEHCRAIQKQIKTSDYSDQDQIERFEDFKERLAKPMNSLISELLGNQQGVDPKTISGLRYWSDAIYMHLSNINKQIDMLAPWIRTWLQRPDSLKQLDIKSKAFAIWRENHSLQSRLQNIPQYCKQSQEILEDYLDDHPDATTIDSMDEETWNTLRGWIEKFIGDLKESADNVQNLLGQIQFLVRRIDFYLDHMEFDFLFDEQREVFFLGYKIGSGRLDKNHYDLLASEARTASLIAIAKDEVTPSHWLHLGRPFTLIGGKPTLISWNGSMFEYLMPNLYTRLYPNTLLYQTALGAVQSQIDYAKGHGVPWGISESSYYRFDSADNYQYQGFGVPDLGRKRGLAEDLVIAPYASLMAVELKPHAVLENISQLKKAGLDGLFGFYEAIDYTKSRLPVGKNSAVIQSYMAHHQGMILVALANFLNNTSNPDRVHKNPSIQSTELLLQERIPQKEPQKTFEKKEASSRGEQEAGFAVIPWRVETSGNQLKVHHISNGSLQMVMTDSGSGYVKWNRIALTRWRRDAIIDKWGIFYYLQDMESGNFWSVGKQPIQGNPQEYRVVFSAHMTEIRRVEKNIHVNLQSTIPPNEDLLLQKITLTNQSNKTRHLRICSYGEVVLAPQAVDQRHPAFNKMFIESSYDDERKMLHFQRRRRSSEEEPLSMAHKLVGSPSGNIQYESDREKFIGRGRDLKNPIIFSANQTLSGTSGKTLDPVFSLGQEIHLNPHETITLTYLTLGASDKPTAERIADKYDDSVRINNAFTVAETNSETVLRSLNLKSDSLEKYQDLLSHIFYNSETLRPTSNILRKNSLSQAGLWPFGVSGDYPILLVTISRQEDIPILQDILQAHSYWRKMGLMIDLVILNTKDTGYTHELNERIHQTINTMDSANWVNRRGGIFVLTSSQINKKSIILIKTAASVIIPTEEGDLPSQLQEAGISRPSLPPFTPTGEEEDFTTTECIAPSDDLIFNNGFGGFTNDGQSYEIFLREYPTAQYLEAKPGSITPAPWINVIANPDFGFMVSESGSGYTWGGNSGENRLSPWFNDPVSNPPGEALYLRDEITGKVWSPTPQPAGKGLDFRVTHGQGYSIFETINAGFKHKLTLFTDDVDPIKIITLKLENLTEHTRRVTATYYVEWVLGVDAQTTRNFVIPDYDNGSDTLLARNTYSSEFSDRVAFLTSDRKAHGLTTSRREFLGFPGSRENPAGLRSIGLTGKVEAGVDPCAAMQTHINFAPGESITIHFVLGQGKDDPHARELANRYSDSETIKKKWQQIQGHWNHLLDYLEIQTPDPSFDIILNRWLLYQAISCRIWGRSAFYQSSGAYGFRDQLQDVTSVLGTDFQIARQHVLRAARHQFEAGDVLHWWHPPSGRGVRTRISDDLLWLVFVTAEYVQATGDTPILEEKVPFRVGEPLEEDEEERYGHYKLTEESFTIFEHCRRALKKGHTSGPHGLPLIGSGDWNDGMNRVGIEGKGESVWLGWFLMENYQRFARLCEIQGEEHLAKEMRAEARRLKDIINEVSWDNAWYLRAFYDDGTPLGSHLNEECQIDSLPQSWSVLTDGGTEKRQKVAMESMKERLLREEDQLILLFTPPFDDTNKDPGYIKGYPPGIRENGGQYTHAAIWAVWAMTKLGQGNDAFKAFQILNPINHSLDNAAAREYNVEPYVVAADIYSTPPHVGHGGWTWYTGSSGWLYRLGTEAILGFQLHGDHLIINPCIPQDWDEYEMTYWHEDTQIEIRVKNPDHVSVGVREVMINGQKQEEHQIPLNGRKELIEVDIIMGSA